ncbi:hypothetical protein PHYSODRAFT_525906 [Phytophthora sojae]|uniref:Retrotransposon gag domain-containing protein n=1 Tax=Phytophthora sojae (strain P6497) TaxID=1094619 RepID=G5A637_PHYSP|nr:hypothetical protein PHYSODRAFT_525906 [Phytophthora sojae]EGZ08792.1 hypothetical protein PHYSODRAFT_525906 [Phytophthora sojae]|eukprot:XP_009535425.1 hypothetical protein PHYSODRAFT_525906 [Phytophthora sojae]
MGGWREQERCTRLYSRLSHNEGTKAWVQQLPATIRHSWTALSDKFAKEFCRSTESPVERYLRLKQDSRETPRTFLWRLNAAAVKANVDYQSPSGCRRHLNQFLKNLRDRELQVSLQGRLYSTVDELEETLRQVEEMERGLCRRPANDAISRQRSAPGRPPAGLPGPKLLLHTCQLRPRPMTRLRPGRSSGMTTSTATTAISTMTRMTMTRCTR